MHIYVLLKKQGHWSNGSSKTMVRKLCDLIDFKDELIYDQGKPGFINSNYFLSVSHSANLMAIAIADQEIGLDLEKNQALKLEVIERVKLDCNQPLQDWCRREATIKLYNNPEYLFKPAPAATKFVTEEIYDGFTCVIASKTTLPKAKIFHLDEQIL